MLIIIGDGGDSNQQADSGADEDIEQQAVEEKVGNYITHKNKKTHTKILIYKCAPKEKVISTG